MANTKESLVKAKVKAILKELGAWYCMPMGSGYGRSGVPDIICCFGYNGLFLAIECKAGKGKTTALQDREIQRIKDAHGVALIVNEENVDALKDDLLLIIREKTCQ